MTNVEVASLIDHTLLKADSTEEQMEILCQEALRYQFASVCVHPTWVKKCAQLLAGSRVKVCTVVGFPLGANVSSIKALEAREALLDGAEELDMVINVGFLKSGHDKWVQQDIEAVVAEAAEQAVVKVIIETSLLTEEQKRRACLLSKKAGAHFVKTSTGFSTGGATVADVQLMRETVGPDLGVKASGGVRDLASALEMIKAGATRIGTSNGIAIVAGETAEEGY